jgi:hypothetical protein
MHIYHVASGSPVATIVRPARTPKGTELRCVIKHCDEAAAAALAARPHRVARRLHCSDADASSRYCTISVAARRYVCSAEIEHRARRWGADAFMACPPKDVGAALIYP